MIKNISTMTREELILALEKETALKHEAGKKLAEAQSSLLKKDIENKKLESIIIKKDELIIKQAELLKLYNIDKYMTQRSILSDDSSEQLSLFSLSAEDEPDEVKAEEDEAAAHKRIKAKKEKHIDYYNLPHKEIIHKADDVKCDNCGEEMVVYKYETKEELVYIPAQVYVEVHKIPYYECRHCIDKDGGTLHSHQDVWKPLIDKSKVSSSLMAALIDYKFNLGLPYYSIEQRLMEDNIVIPRANMSNWMIQMMKYINPLYDMMHQDLLNKEIIAADETAMYVLREEGKKPASSSYLWQYRTCNDEEEISLFEYQPTRSGDVPKKSLEGFNGILLSDKYNGYSKVEKATRAYCHGHSYRYLRDALAILPKESRSSSLEQKAVKKYQKIFITDKKIHDKAARLHPNDKEAYYNYVQEHRVETLKLFQEFLVWLKTIKEEVYMKPKFLEAIKYILNGEEGFKAFIKNPRVELTNNGAERDFRKWVVNRTRSRFYVSTRGAEAASKLYSLMMTAKNNGYNVYSYFDYLFDKIRYEDLNNQETLKKYLPYKKQIPEYCKMQTVKEIRTRIKALEDNQ